MAQPTTTEHGAITARLRASMVKVTEVEKAEWRPSGCNLESRVEE